MVNFCKDCAIEVDEGVIKCPLCDNVLTIPNNSTSEISKSFPDKVVLDSEEDQDDILYKIWELISVAILLPFLILLLTDFITTSTITWSRYPLLSIILFWLMISIPLLLPTHLIVITVGEMLAIMGFLALIDFFDDWTISWFVALALPILIITLLCILFVISIGSRLKTKGLNLIGVILFGVALLNAGLDASISFYDHDNISLSWSIYVITPTILVGTFILYFHYRFMNKPGFRKRMTAIFHM